MKDHRRWSESFRFALEGLKYAVRHERHMKVHLICAGLALLAGWILELSPIRWLVLLLTIALVLSMELMNTAVEKAVDLTTPHRHPLAKTAKDAAAAAVLVTAFFAVWIAAILFYEPLREFFSAYL